MYMYMYVWATVFFLAIDFYSSKKHSNCCTHVHVYLFTCNTNVRMCLINNYMYIVHVHVHLNTKKVATFHLVCN